MSAGTGGGHRRGGMGGWRVEGGGASWAICVAIVFACVLRDNIDRFFFFYSGIRSIILRQLSGHMTPPGRTEISCSAKLLIIKIMLSETVGVFSSSFLPEPSYWSWLQV